MFACLEIFGHKFLILREIKLSIAEMPGAQDARPNRYACYTGRTAHYSIASNWEQAALCVLTFDAISVVCQQTNILYR